MRLRHADGTTVHLAYCTNVHAAEDLEGVLGQLARYGEPVRRRLGADRIGLGLWLAAPVVTALADDRAALEGLREELDLRGIEVVTLNAFPYAGFHAPTVKKAVYRPDWTERARLDHTLACARVLAELLPADAARGSVSTLPLAWREPWSPGRGDLARRHLDLLAEGLADLAATSGRTVRVGFEPEPGCLIETTRQAVRLLAAADPEWLGVCVDTCHLAVAFEEPGPAIARLAAALPVVKTQASCAVHADRPADPAARAALEGFAEQRFLHQTREAAPDGPLAVDDLPEALDGALPGDAAWRIHYHVPVQRDLPPPLRSTRPELVAALAALLGGPAALTDHVEVETYTWPVLPGAPADNGLVDGIAGELAWTRDTLTALGLTEENAS
ncbi:metabolite traffic protein EboE [Streptomyces sp. DT2A-34]|uniref:metabolite traffic protein EboE n=1 Tax=Streptomyces sp. DT2A-34 TaxID=3051182 RepID=UPI00265C43B5|nr:metabolite traffic protein EboE [Streptomyces sp. DT2A-34]MDO0915392.1 metabolite traffic protein EboE [Streptomyces sp. DT2A-34]